MASAGTLLVLITFVTPLATGVRTTVSLGAGPGAQAWLLSAMSVGLAAALLTAGVLADDVGRRRVFTGGLVVVGAGAVVVAVAQTARRVHRRPGAPGPRRGRGDRVRARPHRPRVPDGPGTVPGRGGLGRQRGRRHGPGRPDHRRPRPRHGVAHDLRGDGDRRRRARRARPPRPDRVRRPAATGGWTSPASSCSRPGSAPVLAGLVQSRRGWGGATVRAARGGGAAARSLRGRRAAGRPADDRPVAVRRSGFAAATLGAFVTGVAVIGPASVLPTTLQRGLGESLLVADPPGARLVGREHGNGAGRALDPGPGRPPAARSSGSGSPPSAWRRSASWARMLTAPACCPVWWSSGSATARPTPPSAARRSPTYRWPGPEWAAAPTTPPAISAPPSERRWSSWSPARRAGRGIAGRAARRLEPRCLRCGRPEPAGCAAGRPAPAGAAVPALRARSRAEPMSEAVRTRSYEWGDPHAERHRGAHVSAGIDVLRALAAGELPGAADPRHPGLRTGIGGAGPGRVRPRPGGVPLQPDRLGARRRLCHRARLGHRLRRPLAPAGRGGVHQPRPQREVPPCRRRGDRPRPLRRYGHPPRRAGRRWPRRG